MRKSNIILFFVCSISMFLGCGSSKTSSQDKINLFAGNWNFEYEGFYSGSTEIKIDKEGAFETTITVEKDSRTYTNYIYGEVSETGKVSGYISLSGNRIGSFSGTMNENSGKGIYKTQRGEGVWNLARK